MWSLGVVLYIMLSQRMPFLSNENDLVTKYNILNKDINLMQQSWALISPEAKDLVKMMLVRDKRKRITIKEVISHKWFAPEQLLS